MFRVERGLLFPIFCLAACFVGIASAAEPLPKVAFSPVRRLTHNGEHNAFTDLCRFGDHLYLTYRTCPDGHMVHPTSSIVVLRSTEGIDWQPVHRFQVRHRDTRDPHFLVFQGKLFVYTGTWYCGASSPRREDVDMNQHLGYAIWSANGTEWSEPTMLEGTYGHYVWRAATYGGKAYLCGRRNHLFERPAGARKSEDIESAMLESDDGLVWRTRSLFQTKVGDETAFLFEADGSVSAVMRHAGRREAQWLRSAPPYRDWERTSLDRSIGGPLLARWGDRYVVGGRKTAADNTPSTFLEWLSSGQIVEFAVLPSAGDNSYPGFVEFGPDRALVSYYSSHEKDTDGRPITAIYLTNLAIHP